MCVPILPLTSAGFILSFSNFKQDFSAKNVTGSCQKVVKSAGLLFFSVDTFLGAIFVGGNEKYVLVLILSIHFSIQRILAPILGHF
jgi:hypothetical protein